MPITSLIVRTPSADHGRSAAAAIAAMPGAEVTDHRVACLVVVTDTPSRQADKDLWDRIEALPEVMAVDAIYHNFEDLEGEA